MNNESNIAFHSVISAIQKVALYENKTVKFAFSLLLAKCY